MLRAVVLRLAISGVVAAVVVVAVALAEPPAPSGMLIRQGVVRNARPVPVQIEVWTPAGVLAGAVEPAFLPAGPSRANVTYHLPADGEWSIAVNDEPLVVGRDWSPLPPSCSLGIGLDVGSTTIGCNLDPNAWRAWPFFEERKPWEAGIWPSTYPNDDDH